MRPAGSKKRFAALALGCLAAFLATSCCICDWFSSRRKPEAPVAGDSYSVLGRRKGLRGYLVSYNDWLYRGGAPTGPTGFQALKQLGVRTIISVTPSDRERELAGQHGMELVEVPFTRETGLTAKARSKFLLALKARPRPIYLHCKGGSHRAGSLGALYRVKVDGWNFEKAVEEFVRLGGDEKADGGLLGALKG